MLLSRVVPWKRCGPHTSRRDPLAGPGAELLIQPPGTPYLIQVAAVPSPLLPDGVIATLMTQSGVQSAGSVSPIPACGSDRPHVRRGHRAPDSRPARSRQVHGRHALRARALCISVRRRRCVVRPGGGHPQAAELQRPAVHQALLDVRLTVTSGGMHLDQDGAGNRVSHGTLPAGTWRWAGEVATHGNARTRVASSIVRRLRRSVGDARGLEPEPQAGTGE